MSGFFLYAGQSVAIFEETLIGGALSSVGYAAGVDDLVEHVMQEIPQAVLLDVRLRAHARFFSRWNKSALQACWGERYVHEKRLGNVNYQYPDRSIELFDPEAALPWILQRLQQKTVFVLLCACQDYERCHRKTVLEYILQRCRDVYASGMHFDVARNCYIGEHPAGDGCQVVVSPQVFEWYRALFYSNRVYDFWFWWEIAKHRPDFATIESLVCG